MRCAALFLALLALVVAFAARLGVIEAAAAALVVVVSSSSSSSSHSCLCSIPPKLNGST